MLFSSTNNVSYKSNITDFNIILSYFIIYIIFIFLLYYIIYNISLSPSFLNLKRSILYVIICYRLLFLKFCNSFKGGLFMLPIERINRIKEIVTDKQTIKISELSKILNVSEMTIHRDLKPLIADGYLFK